MRISRDQIAKLITALALAIIVALVLLRRPSSSLNRRQTAAGPAEAIYAMLDAARGGDITAYLSHYSGQMNATLRRAVADQGEAGFKNYLVSSNAAIKGVAVMDPRPVTDGEVAIQVEYVFQDRNERQMMYLENRGGAWTIYRVDASEHVKTTVPYGTPVQ
jgi:hypothetical protein